MKDVAKILVVAAAATALASAPARADGLVELSGERATVVGRLGPRGVLEVNRSLGFVLRPGHDPVSPGAWVRVVGQVLPGSRRDGLRTLLRLDQESCETIEVEDTIGMSDALGGVVDEEAELVRLFALCREERTTASLDALVGRLGRATPAVRRRWVARLAELTHLPPDPVDGLRAVVDGALADGRLERDEWAACRTLWALVDLDDATRARATRWLTTGSAARRTVHAGVLGDLPFEVVAVLLGQDPPPVREDRRTRDSVAVGPSPRSDSAGRPFTTRSGFTVTDGRYRSGPSAGQPWDPALDPPIGPR